MLTLRLTRSCQMRDFQELHDSRIASCVGSYGTLFSLVCTVSWSFKL